MKFGTILNFLIVLFLFSCSDDDDTQPMPIAPVMQDFKVTIENTIEGKSYFQSGAIDAIPPGGTTSFSFRAGKGHFLQFASMFVQTNDVFVGPNDEGLALYDDNGNALSGDITSFLSFWDAGTEVNEMPGSGPNQAPRQSGANVGETENGSVILLSDAGDGFTYPKVEEIYKATLTHDGGTLFTLTIENTSGSSAIPTPFAPGVWVVHSMGQFPVFRVGMPAVAGLEALAEDGMNTGLVEDFANTSGLVGPYAPGAYSIGETNDIFIINSTASAALEALAEDGNPSGFTNVFNTPDGASGPGPIFPMESYSFTFTATDGDNLSLGLMFVQSNDWFVGIDNLSLFSNGVGISGDITSDAVLFDAGTEVDGYAGAGNDQAPRQSGANTGMAEGGNVVIESNTGDHVPTVNMLIKITIERQ